MTVSTPIRLPFMNQSIGFRVGSEWFTVTKLDYATYHLQQDSVKTRSLWGNSRCIQDHIAYCQTHGRIRLPLETLESRP